MAREIEAYGPQGDAFHYRRLAELEEGLRALPASPKDTGRAEARPLFAVRMLAFLAPAPNCGTVPRLMVSQSVIQTRWAVVNYRPRAVCMNDSAR